MNPDTEISEQEQFWELKRKWREETQKMYPDAVEPELSWLFDQALKIDPRVISQSPITKKTYKTFILDANGRRQHHPDGRPLIVTRRFTTEQQKIVKEWWPLIPTRMQGQD